MLGWCQPGCCRQSTSARTPSSVCHSRESHPIYSYNVTAQKWNGPNSVLNVVILFTTLPVGMATQIATCRLGNDPTIMNIAKLRVGTW